MNTKRLTIKLKKITDEEDLEYDDAPTSAEIEVIHKVAAPKLHSILKQRTISESSDDYGLSPTSESPRSDDDLSKLNKSVSFNSRVASTSFHSNRCPHSVHSSLTSKRKKARRKENLKQQRKERHRNNSTGSEYSSGDDLSDTHSQSDTPCTTVEDFDKINEESEDVTEEVTKLAEAMSNGFANISKVAAPEVKPTSVCKEVSDEEKGVKKDASADNQPLDFRTSGKKRRHRGKGRGKKGNNGATNTDKSFSASTDSDENGTTHSNDLKSNKISSNSNNGNQETIGREDQSLSNVKSSYTKEEVGSDLKKVAVAPSSISAPGDLERIAEQNDSSIVKIMGGVEQDSDDDVADNNHSANEHRTKCAFQFSNSVIYDLDVE